MFMACHTSCTLLEHIFLLLAFACVATKCAETANYPLISIAVIRFPDAEDPRELTTLGMVHITQYNKTFTKVEGFLTGLSNGKHGFHVHQYGDTGDKCMKAGGHWNPTSSNHGSVEGSRHIGDLGNIEVTNNEANIKKEFHDSRLPLVGRYSIIGRTLVIHKGEDDLGKEKNKGSKATGNSGARVGCGVIGVNSDFNISESYPAKKHLPKWPLKVTAQITKDKRDHGRIVLIQEKKGAKFTIEANVTDQKLYSDDRLLHVHKKGNLRFTTCDSTQGRLEDGKSLVAKLPKNKDGEINGTFESENKFELLGPDSLVGKSVALHYTDASGEPSKDVDGCGVIGILSDFSPAGNSAATLLSKQIFLVFLFFIAIFECFVV